MEYYYDGQWRSYEDLHDNYGITLTPTTPVILYDINLTEYPGWENEIETWVVADTQWYLREDLPYYRKLDEPFSGYYIDSRLPIDAYSLHDSILYNYNGSLLDYRTLHDSHGVTLTPSTIWGIADGAIWCWYNPDEQLYWDDIKKMWTAYAPEYQSSTTLDIDTVTDFNAVGSIGLFYYTEAGDAKPYGSEIDGRYLRPVSINFPNDGNLNVTKYPDVLSGTWKLMSTASKRTSISPCIVMAIKVSSDPLVNPNLGATHNHTVTNSGIEITDEIDL